MAVMEQDNNFSNISWHSEQNANAPTPGHHAPGPASPQNSGNSKSRPGGGGTGDAGLDAVESGHAGDILECTVSDPHKENDGTKDTYVSYLITTETNFSTFQKPTTQARRRFTDFVFLYKALLREYQGAAVPPLPDKQRMEYVRGDRFGSDFTTRRAYSLQRFLTRITLHPALRKAPIFHSFLESQDWNATMRSKAVRGSLNSPGPEGPAGAGGAQGGGGGVFDSFADSFMNAFTKVHKPDRRFSEVKDKTDKLDEDLNHVEKVVARVARREADLETDLKDLAEQFQKLIALEPGMEAPVRAFSASVEDTASGLRRLKEHTDADYLGSLRDMTAYSAALKTLLKVREQKQLDYEQLTEYLNKSSAERDSLAGGGGSGYGGGSGPLSSASSFIRSKIEDVQRVDHEQSRRDRQRKLELRIDELTREVEQARHEADDFAEQVLHEVANFDWIKRVEFKRQLGGLADAHVEFYGGVIDTWEKYVQEMEKEGFVLPA